MYVLQRRGRDKAKRGQSVQDQKWGGRIQRFSEERMALLPCARGAKSRVTRMVACVVRTYVVRCTCVHFIKSVHWKPFCGGNWNFTTCYMTMWISGHFWGQHRPNVNMAKFMKSSIFIRLTWYLNSIFISRRWIQPAIIFEVNTGQKVNIDWVSKIVNFHPIDLKFEEDLHI